MSFEADQSGRIGQPGYWMWFGVTMIGTVLLLVGGVMQLFRGSWGSGILCILAVLPLSIWFRVIEMRRCRDIGWPAALPWIMLGMQFLSGFMMRPSQMVTGAGAMPGAGMLAAPALLGLADFVLMIVLGCIAGKADDWSVFDDDFDPAGLPQAPRAHPDDLAATAPQAKAYRMPRAIDEPLLEARPVAPPRVMRPVPGLRPAGGFGRKLV
ncbi:MAG: DUF805 domain-containing protein [Sphingomonadales bacterium]|nr:DUF805 domain-containing protein [Sphingomonadales bacterium]